MKRKANTKGIENDAENWVTDEELKQRYPELWKAAKEKVNRIEALWTPELPEQRASFNSERRSGKLRER
ncbi:hypothetical protein [Dyadobacter sp. OTU695]|uniref:hypothetical protein n=1 Tax=Dyadobacter sp. OTU695 TaxID=3043860 RepID=UPI00313B2AEE